jgi:hypothetical protein
MSQLSKEFGCRGLRAKAALANGLEEPKVGDCHLTIDEDSEGEILPWTETQAGKYKPITRKDLRY